MERPKCRTCVYFKFRGSTNLASGECHRRDPESVVDEGDVSAIGVWPQVGTLGFCGEHPDFPAYLRALRDEKPLYPDNCSLSGFVVDGTMTISQANEMWTRTMGRDGGSSAEVQHGDLVDRVRFVRDGIVD